MYAAAHGPESCFCCNMFCSSSPGINVAPVQSCFSNLEPSGKREVLGETMGKGEEKRE